MTITIKDSDGIAGMRVAGRLAAELLDYLAPFVKPGITTNELDRLADAAKIALVQQHSPTMRAASPAAPAPSAPPAAPVAEGKP